MELEHWSAASNFRCGETEPRKSDSPPTLLSGAVWLNPPVARSLGALPAPLLSPHTWIPFNQKQPHREPDLWSWFPHRVLLSGFLRFWAQSFEGDPGRPDLLNLQEQSNVFAGLEARQVWTAQVIGKKRSSGRSRASTGHAISSGSEDRRSISASRGRELRVLFL